ncbi:hypothetical protein BGZ47_010394 [Haplosporangium gracile]|nr:hypothetical protein BGZ47_010394 [Haplosporangium gracile]
MADELFDTLVNFDKDESYNDTSTDNFGWPSSTPSPMPSATSPLPLVPSSSALIPSSGFFVASSAVTVTTSPVLSVASPLSTTVASPLTPLTAAFLPSGPTTATTSPSIANISPLDKTQREMQGLLFGDLSDTFGPLNEHHTPPESHDIRTSEKPGPFQMSETSLTSTQSEHHDDESTDTILDHGVIDACTTTQPSVPVLTPVLVSVPLLSWFLSPSQSLPRLGLYTIR